MYVFVKTAFKAALAEADFQRREYIRVKEGKKRVISIFPVFYSEGFIHHKYFLQGNQVSENKIEMANHFKCS